MRHLRPATWLFAHFVSAAMVVAAVSAEAEKPALAKTGTKSAPKNTAANAMPENQGPAPDAVLASWKGGTIRVGDFQAAHAVKTIMEKRSLATPEGRVQLLRDLERYALLVQEA